MHCKACFNVTLLLFITPFSSQVAQSLCNFQRLWKEGRISDIEREITTAPTPKLCTQHLNGREAGSDMDDEEDDEEDDDQVAAV